MGAMFRWMRMLYLFFAAVTRRLVVFPATADGVAALPVTVTSDAAAWTWGIWVEIDDDIGDKAIRIYQIDLTNPSAAVDYEVQIGYGAAASEVPLGVVTYNLASVTLPFPIEVSAGLRLAARCRDSGGGGTVDIKILAYTIE